jgi:hypothetical protein
METTEHIAKHCAVSPFSVLNENADHVIMMINYIIERGDKQAAEKPAPKATRKDDGFWDF